MINKNNYEAYVLDYLEGTITEPDRQLLLLFLEAHPELKADLEVDINLSVKSTNNEPVYHFKEQLFRHHAHAFDMPVKDFLLIKQLEEGLNSSEEAELIIAEPDADIREKMKLLYQRTQLHTDTSIHYTKKSKLRRFVLMPALRQTLVHRSIAVAASIIISLGIWIGLDQPQTPSQNLASNTDKPATVNNEPTLAQNKILEKTLTNETKPSRDSLLKLSNNPMDKPVKPIDTTGNTFIPIENEQYLASINQIKNIGTKPINAYEYGLNVMMPQYMNNNLLRSELASIYQQIEQEDENPSLSLALVEGGVKVMNLLSKEPMKMNKYYNADGKVVGYQVKSENIEVNRRVK